VLLLQNVRKAIMDYSTNASLDKNYS